MEIFCVVGLLRHARKSTAICLQNLIQIMLITWNNKNSGAAAEVHGGGFRLDEDFRTAVLAALEAAATRLLWAIAGVFKDPTGVHLGPVVGSPMHAQIVKVLPMASSHALPVIIIDPLKQWDTRKTKQLVRMW